MLVSDRPKAVGVPTSGILKGGRRPHSARGEAVEVEEVRVVQERLVNGMFDGVLDGRLDWMLDKLSDRAFDGARLTFG